VYLAFLFIVQDDDVFFFYMDHGVKNDGVFGICFPFLKRVVKFAVLIAFCDGFDVVGPVWKS
jgi:hypothetical protein